MNVLRGFRYRIYPTAEQLARLNEWEIALKLVWNTALSQRFHRLQQWHHGMNVGHVGNLEQQAQLRPAREASEWLADCPSRAQQVALQDLDAAWRKWMASRSEGHGRPRFKGKRSSIGMCLAVGPEGRVGGGAIKLPKIGMVKAVIHRPADGVLKRISISRDIDQWYASVLLEVVVVDPHVPGDSVVGIDRGVALTLADSNGATAKIPQRIIELEERIDKLRARYSKGQRGSNRRRKGFEQVAKLKREVRRIRDHWLHERALYYAKTADVVVVEHLNVKSMTRSAKGTEEEPGTNVAAKAGLNRSILNQGWSRFVEILQYKAEEHGAIVVEVPAAYSSQTCSACGYVSKESRSSQSEFLCVGCGHRENADVNAAKVIRKRHLDGKSIVIGGYQVKKEPKKKIGSIRRKKAA